MIAKTKKILENPPHFCRHVILTHFVVLQKISYICFDESEVETSSKLKGLSYTN